MSGRWSRTRPGTQPRIGPIGQQIGDFYAAGWTRPAIESRGLDRAEALSRPDRCREDARRSGRPVRDHRLLHRPSRSASPPTSRIRRATRSTSTRRGSACRPAIITCCRAPNTTAYPHAPTAHYIAKMLHARRAVAIRKRAPTGSSRSKPRWRRIQWTPERRRDVDHNLQPDDPRPAEDARAAIPLGSNARQARASSCAARSIVGEPSAIAAAGKLLAATPLRPGRTISPSTSSATTRRSCPRRSTTRRSISIRRR